MERLKVFLSSTQKDLQDERNSAEAIVTKLGHDCLRAETYDSPGISPDEACRYMANSCDIYIGIFGPKYGFTVPHLGISVTQLEYREAKTADPGKVLIYVKDTEILEPEQICFLQEVQDFSKGYFRHEKFIDCVALQDQIYNDLITWITRKVRESLTIEVESSALRDKVAHQKRVMKLYRVPEHLI
ncbi:DUF4062 domain-containing protein [Methanosphaerula subterraneus]|uniref:DUF4062 domain-containing protein n=1 Tax=Methanosphaerula subterraneus TaxID=3350244 RepID=UPI003F848E60